MFGLLNINKPSGMTSRDAVNCVQRLVRPAKVGHAGTLDPLATGVLVMCLGPATRLISYIQQMPKSYRGTFLLGRESDTEDIEGTVCELASAPVPSHNEIQSLLPTFTGEIQQRPPIYSALKVAGKRAYELARSGQPVVLEPRPVQIHDLRLVRYSYPEMVIDIRCGSGTYIRSLGRDLAEQLGTKAVMSSLSRTAIGDFQISNAVSPSDLTQNILAECLMPARLALSSLRSVRLTAEELGRIRQGLPIADRFGDGDIGEGRSLGGANSVEISALAPSGELAAILVPRQGGLGPMRNFVVSH